MNNSCSNTLPCGHTCIGFKNEKTCPPCLRGACKSKGVGQTQTQDSEDDCTICYTDNLEAAPIVMLKCGHAFHLHCTKRILENKWIGPRLTFNFMLCPLCKVPMEHPELNKILAPIQELYDDVKRKALMRLQYEGLDKSNDVVKKGSPYFGKPEQYAMDRYCYYPCYQCKKAYFGGAAQCDADAADKDFKLNEMICPPCSGPQNVQNCLTHGADFLAYKCRYCCSLAIFFCFGDTHFCNSCHGQYYIFRGKKDFPHCPAGPCGKQLVGQCPLGINHPPTGQEHCLGCGLCSNMHTF